MALPSSGTLSLNEIHVEAGGSSGSLASINDSDIRGLIGKSSGAAMSFSEWYGATANVDLPIPGSGTNINGQSQYQQITVSTYISSGGQLTIPSSLWIWSDDTSIAALTIDIPCTIVNNGKIIGKGGAGGADRDGHGAAGGMAIKINSSVSNVTITNNSGAYIAGGGGGGGSFSQAGGGGGAGGGAGGKSSASNATGGAGGILNASGAAGNGFGGGAGSGGEAGGSGGIRDETGSGNNYGTGGSGGGRILPGSADGSSFGAGGAGGVAGSAGRQQGNFQQGAGGGGWGAAGGSNSYGGYTASGGAAGKAVEDSGNSYTLSNNGTIYGATT
tara:strand:- start:380 stop:1369 length:990 start_codon:yes stop_codon:yes gene_type:complete